ncbi:MAG TPA: helix-turn-helix domain-containing protein [Candidatus Udaeobacter sp.]|nr:helix-turn-helix domain-containing protein [Candidatus Udaeobacter sp.]
MLENKNLQINLRKIGLSEKEAAIYSAVLDLGFAFPSKIAEITKLNRSTVYKILMNLSVKGLLTEIEKNKKICYQIERPQKLMLFAKEQVSLAEDRLEETKKIIPNIEGLFSAISNKPKVRFFEGLDGILNVYEDHISETEPYEMLGYSNVEELMKVMPEPFKKKYIKAKEKNEITARGIFPNNQFGIDYGKKIYQETNKKFWPKIRFIPADQFPFKGEVTIYGKNKVSIIDFHENFLIGIIIEDLTIAGMMRMIFELAWKGAI